VAKDTKARQLQLQPGLAEQRHNASDGDLELGGIAGRRQLGQQ